jgi:tetratricopeptide (TPR) repeat protein
MELENRLKTHDLLQRNPKDYLLEPVILEHNFSLDSKRNSSKINKKQNGKYTNYSFEKTPLAQITASGQNLSSEELTSFIRFIRYTIGGHSEILDGIKKSGKIPEELVIYKFDKKNNRLDYKLKNYKTEIETPLSLVSYRPLEYSTETGSYYSLISKIQTFDSEKIKQQMGSIEIDIQSSLDNKNYLEALLGCLESGLYNSVFNIEICQTNINIIQADSHAKTLFTYLNPGDQISPEDAYKEFEALEKFAGEKAYILWIFEADMLSRINKKKESLEKFYKALKVNPYIAGIYKDIGEIFYSNYNTDLAWLCWDIARRIYPEHSMLKPITELEENLQKKYPEYF